MMVKEDGGPAFPEAIAVGPAGDVYPGFGGMSLRDWFAGQALMGAAAKHADDVTMSGINDVVKTAYEIADAMLAYRKDASND